MVALLQIEEAYQKLFPSLFRRRDSWFIWGVYSEPLSHPYSSDCRSWGSTFGALQCKTWKLFYPCPVNSLIVEESKHREQSHRTGWWRWGARSRWRRLWGSPGWRGSSGRWCWWRGRNPVWAQWGWWRWRRGHRTAQPGRYIFFHKLTSQEVRYHGKSHQWHCNCRSSRQKFLW